MGYGVYTVSGVREWSRLEGLHGVAVRRDGEVRLYGKRTEGDDSVLAPCGCVYRLREGDVAALWFCPIARSPLRDPAAAGRARRWLADPGTVFIDTETTGFGEADEVIEVAVVEASGRVLLDTLVRPRLPVPPECTRLTGIGEADVSAAPPFREVYPRLAAAVEGMERLLRPGRPPAGVPPGGPPAATTPGSARPSGCGG